MKINFLLALLLSCSGLFSQQSRTLDSLHAVLKNATSDSVRLRTRNEIGAETPIFRVGFWDSLYIDALAANDKEVQSFALNNIGYVYFNQGKVSEALSYFKKGLLIQEENGDMKAVAYSLNNIGFIYDNQGDISTAMAHYNKSLKLREKIGDKEGIAMSLLNIGLVYDKQGDQEKALDFYKRSLALSLEIGDKWGAASSLHNVGATLYKLGEVKSALEYYEKSLNMKKELGDNMGMANSYLNLWDVCRDQKEYPKALDYYQKSLLIQKEEGNKRGVANSLNSKAGVYITLKKYPSARSAADSSLLLAKELGFPEIIRNAELLLFKLDSATGNASGALSHFKQFIFYRDSLINEETRRVSIKSQLKFEFEKKEAVIKEQQEKDKAIANERNQRQNLIIWSIAGGLLLVIVFAGFIAGSLRTTRKQKKIIEEKQKEILDSIRYAKRIQKSLLPTEKYIEKCIKDK